MNGHIIPVSEDWGRRSHVTAVSYGARYGESVRDPDGFWGKEAGRLDWMKPFSQVSDVSWDMKDLHIRWFADGALNVSANCIDRHLGRRGNQTAIIWEGDDPKDSKRISYRQLHDEVCRFANVLKARGVQKGDRVTIYLPMIPEAAYAMLACARIGAVHSVVFGGFSPDSLAGRITDCDSRLVITADEGLRAGRPVPLKANTDEALKKAPGVTDVIVVKRTGGKVKMKDGRDRWYHEEAAKVSSDCPAEAMGAEDPLFILYTSGSTGKPKGVLHTSGGYLLYAAATHQYVFDYHEGDVYWCTADVGWVTGHSYIVYGPLANGATTVMFEGRAQLSHHLPLLGGDRQAQGQYLLYRPHRDPGADARGRRAGEEDQPGLAQASGQRGRADQSGSLAVVPPGGGRRPLPDRGHLVADRDRRDLDFAFAGRDRPEARLGHQALLRHRA